MRATFFSNDLSGLWWNRKVCITDPYLSTSIVEISMTMLQGILGSPPRHSSPKRQNARMKQSASSTNPPQTVLLSNNYVLPNNNASHYLSLSKAPPTCPPQYHLVPPHAQRPFVRPSPTKPHTTDTLNSPHTSTPTFPTINFPQHTLHPPKCRTLPPSQQNGPKRTHLPLIRAHEARLHHPETDHHA